MSYSFNFSAATKAQAKVRVTEEFSKVVAQYGIEHARDLPAAVAAAHAYLDVLADNPTKKIHVSMHGSLGYHQGVRPEDLDVTSAGMGLSVAYV